MNFDERTLSMMKKQERATFRCTELFFDAPHVMECLTKAESEVLPKFGAYVRTRARSSIRTRKRASKPGFPPSSHKGTLKNRIFFVYEPSTRSVVIGPEGLPGSGVPHVLEYGGNTSRPSPRVAFAAGGYGPIAIGRGRPTWSVHGQILVTRTLLRTPGQAARAARIHGEFGLGGRPGYQIAPRPYMGPAAEAERDKLSFLWRDKIKPV